MGSGRMTTNVHKNINELLLPANLAEILDKYRDILTNYEVVPGEKHLYPSYRRTKKNLSVLFPLKEHPVHGKTGLYVMEKYDENGYVLSYHYLWKIIIPKMGVQGYHISAWGNEPHNDPKTPSELIVESEPHHHHHVPGDWHRRQANWTVWTLAEAFEFVAYYIRSEQEYKP